MNQSEWRSIDTVLFDEPYLNIFEKNFRNTVSVIPTERDPRTLQVGSLEFDRNVEMDPAVPLSSP